MESMDHMLYRAGICLNMHPPNQPVLEVNIQYMEHLVMA